jgi:transposase-like protein
MAQGKQQRRHSTEFRIEIAARMLAGENVKALSERYQLPRSMMYRWRDAYRKDGAAGFSRSVGRPRQCVKPVSGQTNTSERMRQRIAELERKVGQQAVEIDFFKGVFKRLEELPKTRRRGGEASTRRSDE